MNYLDKCDKIEWWGWDEYLHLDKVEWPWLFTVCVSFCLFIFDYPMLVQNLGYFVVVVDFNRWDWESADVYSMFGFMILENFSHYWTNWMLIYKLFPFGIII